MTNKEKASKIIDRIFLHGLNANNTFYNMAETAVLEMAEWKDSQPQIIEIFGKRVKIVEDTEDFDGCSICAFCSKCLCIDVGSLCEDSSFNINRHFVEVDKDGNEIGGDK